MKVKGTRRDLVDSSVILEPGEYGKHYSDGTWLARPPNPDILMGNLGDHDVTEHDDGTITVSPSILIKQWNGKQWHGYLERGVWREV